MLPFNEIFSFDLHVLKLYEANINTKIILPYIIWQGENLYSKKLHFLKLKVVKIDRMCFYIFF